MIKISKSKIIPPILLNDGVIETNNLKSLYIQNKKDFSKPVKIVFKSAIYAHETVKEKLKSDQSEKCCYCEAKFTDNGFGDVEHFRPKKAYIKKDEKKLTYPGYYWLAYDWNNLLFSCQVCNTKFKKNHFPLEDENTRSKNHLDSNLIENETNLLIDPINEDPSNFITFNKEIPIPKNTKGKINIELFGLERMNDTRLEYLTLLKSLLIFSKYANCEDLELEKIANTFKIDLVILKLSIKESVKYYNEVAKSHSKFTLCIRSNFPNLPQV